MGRYPCTASPAGWSDAQTIVLAVALAFVVGYAFTIGPVMRSGPALGAAIPVALARGKGHAVVHRFHGGDAPHH